MPALRNNDFRRLATGKKCNLHCHAWQRQQGLSTLAILLFFPITIAFVALALDVGHFYIVRVELQNAADAAALSGASYLVRKVGNITNLDYVNAKTQAGNTIPLNQANGKALIDGTLTTGCWNPGDQLGLQAEANPCNLGYYPAIQVTLGMANGSNNGPVNSFFGDTLLGIASLNMQATAVAIVGGPGTVSKNLLPLALSKCLFDSPIIGPFDTDSVFGATCHAAKWTTFTVNEISYTQSLINLAIGATNSSSPLQTSKDEIIWIQPDNFVTPADYNMLDACSAEDGDSRCAYTIIPVVNGDLSSTVAEEIPVVGFACVEILNGKNSKISMQLVLPENADGSINPNYPANCQLGNVGGISQGFGANLSPRLVNYSGNDY